MPRIWPNADPTRIWQERGSVRTDLEWVDGREPLRSLRWRRVRPCRAESRWRVEPERQIQPERIADQEWAAPAEHAERAVRRGVAVLHEVGLDDRLSERARARAAQAARGEQAATADGAPDRVLHPNGRPGARSLRRS